jgi:hypothetical protein
LRSLRPRPAIDPFAAAIDGWLLADQNAPRKQRNPGSPGLAAAVGHLRLALAN